MDTCHRTTLARKLCGAMLAHGLFLLTPEADLPGFVGRELREAFLKSGSMVIHLALGDVPSGQLWDAIAASAKGLMPGPHCDDSLAVVSPHRVSLFEELERLQAATAAAVIVMLEGVERTGHEAHADDWAAMFALKSARDQMNRPWLCRLGLVMTSASERSLAGLLRSNAAPFYGSIVRRLETEVISQPA